ncbi:YdiU family protein [Sphingomonadales bacterium 56]|uniref:protein adenylyltransferase SelO n=1 Tax=unclassified Sphingobium TaxID=2611147 RepID=UPI00191A18B1|nr:MULTISPECIES: YdiU family protein [unclassified Sphingobium]MBY2927888.1 YdiU family protein [Sphingomonadales bacterium 56]MBY2957988.1 YdiU family protein [Sphingomonadales bacterium 58]CAD7336144.1 Protein adenylyltransferase SelO [Sphingobium sp. S6]CAD7336207.1 Protein adenylyltransferase SelO [Sphingobium sp. S8]
MDKSSQASRYNPAKEIFALQPDFADEVAAANFPQTILRYRNDRAAASVGLDRLSDEEWLRHFGRFEPLSGSLPQPLALRYHGHQFRVYNPDIGDGRGFLFAQLRDEAGRLLDLGTKGSGQTPYSRFGDGRLTLKGGVREILATEMLEALGVNTSKTFSLIETGEALERHDEPSPTRSAVMVRLSHSHIRIGSFQRAAYFDDKPLLERLTDYVLRNLYNEEPGNNAPAQLLGRVVERTADLAASYMVAGFVHGVLNSDNINVTGESFDYGPWRFTPCWEPGFTAAYFDHAGLYAFGRQAEAIHWDVAQLAVSLRSLVEAEPLIEQLERFPELFGGAMTRRFCWRLGVVPSGDVNAMIEAAVKGMAASTTQIDRFFHDWRGGEPREGTDYSGEVWAQFREAVAGIEPSGRKEHAYWSDAAPCSMHIDEVESIWSAIAERDDWSPLQEKVAAIRRMGEALGRGPEVP